MPTNLKKPVSYTALLNKSLSVFFKQAVSISAKNPSQALNFIQTVNNQQKAARVRAGWEKQGLQVPPMMIMSITNRCNLHCRGCYHQALRDISHAEMSEAKLRDTLAEASRLGVSFIILAGGEPLARPEILNIVAEYPRILFLMFTNGLMIDEATAIRLKTLKNLVPLISLEGLEKETDLRRGGGVYARLTEIMAGLNKRDIFFGNSITVTSANFNTVMSEEYIRSLSDQGCKMFFFVEYSEVQSGSSELMIDEIQRLRMSYLIAQYRKRFPATFISVPGDEKDFGGCLVAGRGFIHISAEGDVEPCPFAPYSDVNLRESTLAEALQSEFLKSIRESPEPLESGGGCSLMARKDWVQAKLAEN
jgi:MoaA/NifB/PqqE/SkfB family radical SAM enzyme